jgi:multidrug efflux pump subunit AcrA (membrane-fusion protein)
MVVLAFAATGGIVANPVSATAANYPTWEELQKAKADTRAAAKAVDQIIALIAELEQNVEIARAEAERRTEELLVAQQQYDDAVRRADQIQSQADAASEEAAAAERNAGQVAAQLYRTGSTGLGINLLIDAGDASRTDELLARLGSMEKLVERTADIYVQAKEAGKELVILPWSAAGLELYSAALVASDRFLEERPDVARRFLAAYKKSIEFAYENPKEAAEAVSAMVPELSVENVEGSLKDAMVLFYNDVTEKDGLGAFEEGRLTATWERVSKAQGLDPASLDPETVVDRSFAAGN